MKELLKQKKKRCFFFFHGLWFTFVYRGGDVKCQCVCVCVLVISQLYPQHARKLPLQY